MFIPRLTYNCQTWLDLTTRDLQASQLNFLRLILEIPSGIAIAALYLELAIWPIKHEIDKRRLIFIKRILDRDSSDPCLQVYEEMLKVKDEPSWANDALSLHIKCNLSLDNDNIRNMSVDDWNTFVKTAVRKRGFPPVKG